MTRDEHLHVSTIGGYIPISGEWARQIERGEPIVLMVGGFDEVAIPPETIRAIRELIDEFDACLAGDLTLDLVELLRPIVGRVLDPEDGNGDDEHVR